MLGCVAGRRARTPPPCAPSPCAPAPRAPAPCAPAPCAPAPSSAPPCSPDPYANIRRPKRFFSPIRGRRAATPPPCAPSPCAPAPPSSPPPCSPDPYANIRRPKRYFSPLAALAKSVSLEYDEDPFYGSNYSGREVEACCCSPPPPSPEPCPASPGRHRGSVPKGFYTLTGDISPKSTPRRTSPCPAAAPCPAQSSYEVERRSGGVARRTFSRDCPASASSDGQSPVSASATASFTLTTRQPEEFIDMPLQDPLGPWVDPGPMWPHATPGQDDSIDCSCEISGDDPFTFLDRGQGRFNTFPPSDSCCCDEGPPALQYESVPCPANTTYERVPCPANTTYEVSPTVVCTDSRSRSGSPCPCPDNEEYIDMPLQDPLGSWVETGPMWEAMVGGQDDAVVCRCSSGEDPFAFLDEPVPSFSYPPIHPSRR
ncbi:uncharacterized protein LOC126289431 [Schistocerca gregaria]|uniref:uncharacterized protein LOC126289431 n=1 Tax=Schistocerca gregaria TaxID=7010 RepID=UPI00211F3624|nr:uncharacterized protein LOC126289431 [Schistocerca gregaria]